MLALASPAHAAPVVWDFEATSCTVVYGASFGGCDPAQQYPALLATLTLPGPDSSGSAVWDSRLPALVWTRVSSGRIHCAEPKRPLSTAGLATCGQSSFYWDTRKLKVRCATWGLRSTTLSP
jgi:hypothetical protein